MTAVVRDPASFSDPVLRLIAQRVHSGRRDDGARIALGIEGGGLAVSMAAGMAHALERLGVTRAVDVVYGTSSGALIAAYAAAGRMDDAAVILPQTCTRRFVSFPRALRGRPVVSLDFLMGLVRARPPRPVAPDQPEFRTLVVGVTDGALRTLCGFRDEDELLQAVRASMSLPFFAGAAATYRGEVVSDGGLIESIPVATPLADGATHVLALRSRDRAYRKGTRGRAYGMAEDAVVNRLPGRLPELIRARPARYDAEAEALAGAERGLGPLAGRAAQLAPAAGTPLVGRLQADRMRVEQALRDGRAAAERALT